jgi:predicted DNA-binding transcriptional regulator YafY
MARSAEVVRQWTVLKEIERSRGAGVTIDELARVCKVTTRTIRRDLQALEEAGFPLFDDRSRDDGRTRWCIDGQAFRALAAGLTISELCALYFSRELLKGLSGTPFRNDLESAFEKLASVLTPHMRQFLDQLPRVIAAKADPMRKLASDDGRHARLVSRIVEATLHHRKATLTYDSRKSERTRTYVVHPHRLAFAMGGMYLLAYVPDYDEERTFAIDRIRDMSLLEERFTPVEGQPDEAFPNSLGVHSGPPERIELEFDAAVADYVRARAWHRSQVTTDRPGGGLGMTLDVCRDQALTSWILSFGPLARVVSPEALAREIAGQFEQGRARYQ